MQPHAAAPPAPPLGQTAKSLPAQLAEQLLSAIMAGHLPPGARLKEIQLSQEHAVSRATVRQALALLEKQRFVVRVPRYGARVTTAPKEELYELFEIRTVLLGLAARRAAELASDAALGGIEGRVAQIEALAAKRSTDPRAFAKHTLAAQHAIMAASGNRLLADLYEQLANMSIWQVMRAGASSFATPKGRQESAHDWRCLADRLRRRNAQLAEEAARRMLVNSARRVREQLEVNRRADNVVAFPEQDGPSTVT